MQKCLGCPRYHRSGEAGIIEIGGIGIVCAAQINKGAYWRSLVGRVAQAMADGKKFVPGANSALIELHAVARAEVGKIMQARKEALARRRRDHSVATSLPATE